MTEHSDWKKTNSGILVPPGVEKPGSVVRAEFEVKIVGFAVAK